MDPIGIVTIADQYEDEEDPENFRCLLYITRASPNITELPKGGSIETMRALCG